MKQELINICRKWDLTDDAGNLLPLNQALKVIYYDWDKTELLDFMDALVVLECGNYSTMGIGESLFDD